MDYKITKRVLSIVLSVLLIIITSPIMLVTYLLIQISGGNAVYTQDRVGINGEKFKIYKFRSMVKNSDSILEKRISSGEVDVLGVKDKNDDRITKIGKIIRTTSIDELPQLFNILKGDMAIVGPRPLNENETERISKFLDIEKKNSIRPGLVCYWQVTKNKNDMLFEERMALDMKYIDEVSPIVDIKIFIQAIRVVLSLGNH
ncbi:MULTISPECIES: sugar transferase [unclassified Gemella]|uniref:sugar transferase n=1 Tax=unclassified Gemella TaxID=2624949 RepID=UPI0015D00E9A|nr:MULTISPECIES: sugar transferase [unclassified Gemella]MBF0709862.1 sugar transferase [Gemella sp. GL1.1]NYS27206.1 sugar transferase [Gemella sp. GL1]